MGLLAEAASDQDLFPLPGAEFPQVLFKLNPLEAQFAEDGEKEALLNAALRRIVPQGAAQKGAVLRHIGETQATQALHIPAVGDRLAADQLQ